MTFLGQLVGNLIAGTSSDMFGRKIVFQATMLVWGVASPCAASAWSVSALMVFRFLIGVGVGGEAPVAQAMVSEIVPANVRGKYIAIMEGFWAVGFVLSGSISYFLLPYLGWRWVFVVVGLLSAVVFVVRRSIPESPRWLADHGRLDEADARDDDDGTRGRAQATGQSLPPAPATRARRRTDQNPFATLFSPDYRGSHGDGLRLWFFALLGFFGLNSWIAVLLGEHGFSIVKLGRLRHADHVRRHPRLLHGSADAGEDRPQADDRRFSRHVRGDRLHLRHASDVEVTTFRTAVTRVRLRLR